MKNRTLILRFKVVAGSSVKETAEDLALAAERFGVGVEADFNGAPMIAYPGDDAAEVVRMFHSIREILERLPKP